MPLKHRQDGFGRWGNLCVHAATDSGRVLRDRSGEPATTPKIVTVQPTGWSFSVLIGSERSSSFFF